jgi:hypothetical protein
MNAAAQLQRLLTGGKSALDQVVKFLDRHATPTKPDELQQQVILQAAVHHTQHHSILPECASGTANSATFVIFTCHQHLGRDHARSPASHTFVLDLQLLDSCRECPELQSLGAAYGRLASFSDGQSMQTLSALDGLSSLNLDVFGAARRKGKCGSTWGEARNRLTCKSSCRLDHVASHCLQHVAS